MNTILNVLIVGILAQTSSCVSIKLDPNEHDKSLSTTATALLSSFKNCNVYVFDWDSKHEYSSLRTSAKYFLLYSDSLNWPVVVDSITCYRNKSAANPRFLKLQPHPLFTKYTKILINLYVPATNSAILRTPFSVDNFYDVIVAYNIPFNYVLIFMSNEEFSSVDDFGMFSWFVTIGTPAAYMLVLEEQSCYVICFAHLLRSAPYLFRVTKFEEASYRRVHEVIHRDLQGATARVMGLDAVELCMFGKAISTSPYFCIFSIMADNFNVTFSKPEWRDGPRISEIIVRCTLTSQFGVFLSRSRKFNCYFVNDAVFYGEFNFLCIAKVKTVGLMAFVQAYDLLTWTVTATACICLSAAIASMAPKTAVPFWAKFQSAVPFVLMLLIERFKVIRLASRQVVLVITLWAFGAMLLGMCYSGNMISLLTSPSLPSCPQDLNQLAEVVEYPLFTFLGISLLLALCVFVKELCPWPVIVNQLFSIAEYVLIAINALMLLAYFKGLYKCGKDATVRRDVWAR